MKLPCEQCPVLAICKHKYYEDIIFNCGLIAKYLSIYKESKPENITTLRNRHEERLKEFMKIVKPSKWGIHLESNQSGRGYRIDLFENDKKVHWASTYF